LLIATNRGRLAELERLIAAAGWQVLAFDNPREALEALKENRHQAVFCDAELRGASAQGFLVWQQRLSPGTPFYLIGAEAPPRGVGVAPSALLPFPLPLAKVPVPPDTQVPQAPAMSEIPLAGDTALIALADLLAMMGLAEQSAAVELGHDGEVGMVQLERGTLVHAETPQQRGLLALAALLVAPSTPFRVLPPRRIRQATVNLPVATALTEAARLADEQQRYRRLIDAVARACPALHAAAAGYLLGTVPAYSHTKSGSAAEGEALFDLARRLIEAQRQVLGSRPSEGYLRLDDDALALCLFGEDHLLAARAPAAHAEQLCQAVQRAVGRLLDG
jgi:hypothetical protein